MCIRDSTHTLTHENREREVGVGGGVEHMIKVNRSIQMPNRSVRVNVLKGCCS